MAEPVDFSLIPGDLALLAMADPQSHERIEADVGLEAAATDRP
jgi:hypothetical protein